MKKDVPWAEGHLCEVALGGQWVQGTLRGFVGDRADVAHVCLATGVPLRTLVPTYRLRQVTRAPVQQELEGPDPDRVTAAFVQDLWRQVSTKPLEGVKYDTDKARMDLLPPQALLAVGKVLAYGAKKYAPDNWKKVQDARARYIAASLRHLLVYMGGERLDPESGEPHLAHAITCLLFVLELDAT